MLVEAVTQADPKDGCATALGGAKQWREFILGDEFGGEEIVADEENADLRNGQCLLDFDFPLGSRDYSGVIPDIDYVLSNHWGKHRLEFLDELPVFVAVAKEDLRACGHESPGSTLNRLGSEEGEVQVCPETRDFRLPRQSRRAP